MLACLSLEEGRDPAKSRAFRAEQLNVLKHGRWMGWHERRGTDAGPLQAQASWHHRASRPLFEPRENGGVGLEPRLQLLQMGVTEVNQLCASPFLADGLEGRWILDRKEAGKRVVGPISATGWKQWLAVVETLQRRGVRPAPPESRDRAALRTYQARAERSDEAVGWLI